MKTRIVKIAENAYFIERMPTETLKRKNWVERLKYSIRRLMK